ncbi:hypothetical protein BaRGS_00023628 [Batillaria attramentaria]|uniref:Apple domain-containing protein n=1 Tax=Batillaria attramentaria TaxID=370345 RepID=A0ABD0KDB4_9CAEN
MRLSVLENRRLSRVHLHRRIVLWYLPPAFSSDYVTMPAYELEGARIGDVQADTRTRLALTPSTKKARADPATSPGKTPVCQGPRTLEHLTFEAAEISALCNKPDCAACIGFECFFGQCLCKPGYYYSVGSQICVETCNETDLLQDFVKYAVSGIGGYNMEAYGSITLEECMARCVSNTACLTFEYYKEDGTCNLQPVTALDVGWKRGNDFGWDLYQRMCA